MKHETPSETVFLRVALFVREGVSKIKKPSLQLTDVPIRCSGPIAIIVSEYEIY